MKTTPAQQQYLTIKAQHKDCLLLFRLGDFYEMFYEDAHIAHRVLDITLTARDKTSEHPIPMAGIPHHALEKYLPKLVKAGYKVALAEQIGEVIPGKVVERAVKRIVTAGTYIEQTAHIGCLCGISYSNANYHVGLMNVSTGTLHIVSFPYRDALVKYILKHSPTEIVIDIDMPERAGLEIYLQSLLQCTLSISDTPHNLTACICHHLGVTSIDGYGKALIEGRERVFGVLANYLLYTLKQEKLFFTHISYGFPDGVVHLDDTTIRNLELFSSSYEQKSQHSLYTLINTCQTAMGSRLLMERLQYPTNNKEILLQRQALLCDMEQQSSQQRKTFFSHIPDIPKILSILTYKGVQAHRILQLRFLADTFLSPSMITEIFWNLLTPTQQQQSKDIYTLLQTSLIDHLPLGEEGYIAPGTDAEIDSLRTLVYHTDEVLSTYHEQLIQTTGIASLKVKYIQHQGYCLEISKQHQERFEAYIQKDNEQFDFSRRGSLKNGERYTTSYLNNLEHRIAQAKTALALRENQILSDIYEKILAYKEIWLLRASYLAEYDLARNHLQFAHQHHWVCPTLDTKERNIVGGRHPLVEQFLSAQEQFIPNNLIYEEKETFHLITGPNMGGKTTYLKQNALIVLLAHAGLRVPSQSASIPLVDAIFARIGTGDILAKQQSTFMTEMIEMANILHNATDRSFLVLDEIGRGTSTYDGLALARSICEYLIKHSKAKTLFATHYHELIALEKEFPSFINYSVSVYETDQSVIFLKKIVKGGASKSYGIDVALRAGIPQSVIDTAKKHLTNLESKKGGTTLIQQDLFSTPTQTIYTPLLPHAIQTSLESLDLNSITPLQALIYISELKGML